MKLHTDIKTVTMQINSEVGKSKRSRLNYCQHPGCNVVL